MAHGVRTEDPQQNGTTHDRAGEISIDLRHGDLSDDEVVAILLQLARERAASDGTGATPTGGGGTGPEPRGGRPRRRVPARTALAVAGVVAVLLVAVLAVLGVRARRDPVAAPAPAGATDTGSSASTAAAPTTVGAAAPSTSVTTVPPRVPVPAATATTVAAAAADPTVAFCRAVGVYTLDNLVTLAENGVRDPQGTIAAYGTMVANAPPEIAADVAALGPITGKVQVEIQAGRITTPAQMQQFLAGGAPAAEVTTWITAQQAIVAQLPRLCPGHAATP